MNRRNFLSTVASSPLLGVVSLPESTEKEEISIKADVKRHSRRLVKYKDNKRSMDLYFEEERWIQDIKQYLSQMGIQEHCVFEEITNTSVIYAAYKPDKDGQIILYQVEPAVTVISIREYGDYYTVAGNEVQTRREVRQKLEELSPEKRGDWAL